MTRKPKRRYPRPTLDSLRKQAPRQDRDNPALKPSAAANDGKRPTGNYERRPYFAETLDQLAGKCGRYGPAAVAEARWGAITAWLMKEDGLCQKLSNSADVAETAVGLVKEYDRATLGYPNHTGKPFAPPALNDLSPECQQEAMHVAAETVADWERAGSPYLTRDRLKSTQQLVHACISYGTAASSTDHIFKSKDTN